MNIDRDFDYENNNIGYDDQYTKEDGGGIKCKNYIVCETVLPKWWFECKSSYLCINCDMMFGNKGILKTTDNLECPICLEIKKCISQPRCDHSLCIKCFKNCYYLNEEGEPIFPYPDIEDEYFKDTQNIKWENNYPLIKIYQEEYSKWDDERIEKYMHQEYLRICCICRK